jgi:ring-1,2-phenylacetyl-CoA epoxidase subunit PaaC
VNAAPTLTTEHALNSYLLRHADDSLVHGQRLCEWVARAPRIEDDVALLNIALDHIGHARTLLTTVGEREGRGRSEDDLAFGRSEMEFSNARVFELPNGDFGQTVAKLVCVAMWETELFGAWAASDHAVLAEFGSGAERECRYHLKYATTWATRLAGGTQESADRLDRGFAAVWPHLGELLVTDTLVTDLTDAGVIPDHAGVGAAWTARLYAELADLGLARPELTAPTGPQGRQGNHLESFTSLLAEMQYLHRAHPGAAW